MISDMYRYVFLTARAAVAAAPKAADFADPAAAVAAAATAAAPFGGARS
ncbi:hypothetical protein ACFPK5_36455 [Streptomyces beijiangensis]